MLASVKFCRKNERGEGGTNDVDGIVDALVLLQGDDGAGMIHVPEDFRLPRIATRLLVVV